MSRGLLFVVLALAVLAMVTFEVAQGCHWNTGGSMACYECCSPKIHDGVSTYCNCVTNPSG